MSMRSNKRPTKRRFRNRCYLLACVLMPGALLVGCATPCREESFSTAFDAEKVASLSHEAYKVSWQARFWAEQNLRYAAFRPTTLDWDVVKYLDDISWNVPWIARKIEQNPATPRVASKFTYDIVAYDAMILRLRYQPTSFQPSTCAQIERLLRLVDEMAPYYSQKKEPEALRAQQR